MRFCVYWHLQILFKKKNVLPSWPVHRRVVRNSQLRRRIASKFCWKRPWWKRPWPKKAKKRKNQANPLSRAQIRDLQSREITPEDYDLLLLLDEGVKPARASIDPSSYIKEQPADVTMTCSICIAEIERGETAALLSCGHGFHRACVEQWLTRKAACPMCGDLD